MSGLSGSHCLQGTIDLTASLRYCTANTSGFVVCDVGYGGNSLTATIQLVKYKLLSELDDLSRGVRSVGELKWKEH
jgi:hypothetical protein